MRRSLLIFGRFQYLLIIVLFLGINQPLKGQTVLIDPSGDGGFENGATYSTNGWIVVNDGTNIWAVGTATKYAGGRSAYVSNDGTSNQYSNSTNQTSHFYRDITVPFGVTGIDLSFYLKGIGEAGYDRLLVYTAPTSVVPIAGEPVQWTTTIPGATLVYTQPATISGYTLQTVALPATLAGTTFRLIFTWQNDNNAGNNPPAAVDNISLTARSQQVFTTSENFIVPLGVTQLTVECWGGGGGGTNASSSGRGGGGGGAYTKGILNVTPGQSLAINVGAGGSAGKSGGNTNVGIIVANGGGSFTNSNSGGLGGSASPISGGVLVSFAGGNGGSGSVGAKNDAGGGGGGSAYSNGVGKNGGDGPNSNSVGGTGGTGTGNGGAGGAADNSPSPQAGTTPGGGGGGRGEDSGTSASGASGQVIITWDPCTTPNAYIVTGGGTYCSGGTGVQVGLSGSESGVTYQLYIQGSSTGSPVQGTGSAISFGSQTAVGNYSVIATRTSGSCTANMSGVATVTVSSNPVAPTSVFSDRNNFCSDDAGNITLTANGGSGTTIKWFTDSCGGTEIGTGNPLVIQSPSVTTTYYARWETSCGASSCASTTVNISPSQPISLSLTANPEGNVCEGTAVTYTALPDNAGSSPSYSWKINGITVGGNSDNYTYTPSDGDVITCVVTSSDNCAEGESTIPVLYFSWDDSNKQLIDSDFGINALSINDGQYASGGVNGTYCLAPIAQNANINLTFDGSLDELNCDGIDCSVSYLRGESVSQMFTRGSSLIITGGANFGVSYRVSDGAGSFSTVSSGNVYAIPNDGLFHNYRFKYDPSDGYGRLYVDGAEIWASTSSSPGMPLYWNGSGNLIVGAETDASGTQSPTFDNLSVIGIKLYSATAQISATVATDNTVNLLSGNETTDQVVCQDSPINNISYVTTGATGVSFTGLPSGVNGSWTQGIVTISGAPTSIGTFNYTVTTTGGCGLATVTGRIVVNELPVAIISGTNSPVCSGKNALFFLTGSDGAMLTYNINGGTNNTITLTGGTATIAVDVATEKSVLNLISVSNESCTRNLSSKSSVEVNPLPTPVISGDNSPCIGSVSIYTTEAGMSNYSWSISSGGAITSGQGTNSVEIAWGSPGQQTINVTYTNSFSCTTESPTIKSVNVNPLPNTGPIIPD